MNVDLSSRFVQVNGATIHYGDGGGGATLILIHGGLSTGTEWQPLLPELADGFRVITPDSRGHGRSTNPSGELSYELAVCPWLSHDGPAPERAQILASLIRDFAGRHAER